MWLFNASLALMLAAGLVWGPLIADRGWDRGVHVTPAQAALHQALIASGFTHHHGGPLPHAAGTAAADGSSNVQAGASGTSWGTPLPQLMTCLAGFCLPSLFSSLTPGDQPEPAGVSLPPLSPPPQQTATV